jgi:hypothetical protein
MLLLGDLISFNPVTSTHPHFHNDLLCYLCSRSPLHPGYSCPSPAWQCFYYSYVVVDGFFVFADLELVVPVNPEPVVLVDPKSVVLVDPKPVVILVQQQQRLPMLRGSYAVSAR